MKYVKIISAQFSSYWYADRIGETFKVDSDDGFMEYSSVSGPGIPRGACILAEDCIEVETQGAVQAFAEVAPELPVHASGISFDMLNQDTYKIAAEALSAASLNIVGAVRVEFYKHNGQLRSATGYLTAGSGDKHITVKEIGVGYRSFRRDRLVKVSGEKIVMQLQK